MRKDEEQIGKVKLDYSCYPGEDYYSEGGSEDTLLSLVKLHEESEYNQVILEFWSWPVLYHLSHIRGNVVNWLPIGPSDRVLEIGSGCGAVTASLSAMAGSVTCIELSKKRSLINANRNKNRDNIEIKVGNFQDIEPKLTQQYDYIMLIGVLEYASSYIAAKNPHEEFLRIVGRHLAPGGKIVVAIENKYGLKYWAGCKEDHTGRYYEGIEGYPNTEGVRTFSRQEISELADKCGLKSKFYYPYPDYKFPMAVYSDGYLPKTGELNNNMRNFDGDRVVAFDETKAFDGLIRGGMFPFFSNSFLVLLENADNPAGSAGAYAYGDHRSEEADEILFAKFSNERARELMIRTDILKGKDGVRKVRKTALTGEARAHVDAMKESARILGAACEGTRMRPNRMTDGRTAGTAYFEYLTGQTLEEKLDGLLAEENYEGMLDIIREFTSLAEKTAGAEEFSESEEFCRVFGDKKISKTLRGCKISNLDLIFSNILEDEEGNWNVIDYEWTFRFPIPVQFVIYRALYYYVQSGKRQGLLDYLASPGAAGEVQAGDTQAGEVQAGDTQAGEVKAGDMQAGEVKVGKEAGKAENAGREAASLDLLCGLCGITPDCKEVFEVWENHFQRYIVGGTVSLYVAHALVAGLTLRLADLVEEGSRLNKLHAVKVYYDFGQGFSEEHAHFVRGILSGRHRVSVDVLVEKGVVRLRIDPTEFPCVLRMFRFTSKRRGEFTYQVNAAVCLEDTAFFDTSDAQILIDHVVEEDESFHLEYQVDVLDEPIFSSIVKEAGLMQYREVCKSPTLEEKVKYKLGTLARPVDPRTLKYRTLLGNKDKNAEECDGVD